MVTAIVMIKAETNRIPALANQIAEMAGVQEVFQWLAATTSSRS